MTAPTGIPPQSLGRLFARFLRFGALAWGGPVAQIAMLKKELVEEERWVPVERFHRALAVYQVLPGPEAHELCVWFGMLARGRWGALVAGLGFLLPGLTLMLLLAWAYVTVGLGAAWVAAAFAGIQAAVVALVVRAVQRLAAHALSTPALWAIGGLAFVLTLAGFHFALLLALAALAHPLLRGRVPWPLLAVLAAALAVAWGLLGPDLWRWALPPELLATGPASELGPAPGPLPPDPPGVATLFGEGLRAGLLTFGGAYTAIPLLQRDAVVVGRWMTNGQFLDGIALGGVLPAPLIIFGTFVGFVGGGVGGALALTLGIFLPAFLFTLVGHELFERLTQAPRLRDALDGVTAAVVGLVAATAIPLARAALVDATTSTLALASLALLFLWRSRAAVPAAILAAGLLGALLLRA